MKLTKEQIERFKKSHEPYGGLDSFSDEQIADIANGLSRLYLRLFQIQQRIRKEEKESENNKQNL